MIVPGCLVVPKRTKVTLWPGYIGHIDDGCSIMTGADIGWLDDVALVIGIVGTARNGNGLVALLVAGDHRFCYTWSRSLIVL